MAEALTINPVRNASRPMRDTSRDWDWINEHTDEYRGQWVMVYDEHLIIADANIRNLLGKVPQDAYSEAVVAYVPTVEESQRGYLWTPTRSPSRTGTPPLPLHLAMFLASPVSSTAF